MKLLFFNAYTSFKHMKLKHLLNMMQILDAIMLKES